MNAENITNLVLQPFINYPFDTNDFDGISEHFDLSKRTDERFWQVGLRIVVSNGNR